MRSLTALPTPMLALRFWLSLLCLAIFAVYTQWQNIKDFNPQQLPIDEFISLPRNIQPQHRSDDTQNSSTRVRVEVPAADIKKWREAQQPTKSNRVNVTNTAISPPALSRNKTSFLVYTNMLIDRKEPCDIPCEYTSSPNRRPQADASVYERRGYSPPDPGDKVSVYLQMEGVHYYPIKMDGYHLENSYRWQSPLLKPYFEWVHYQGDYNISNPPVSWNDAIDGATFIARNCHSHNNRESIVKGLRDAGIRVDGLSSCFHSRSPPQNKDKLAMMHPYKFNLAFENGNVEDYVTEKVYQALAAGVVPVYMGAPNIRDYVPDGSIIDVADFGFNASLLAEHLQECINNQSLYESYHMWRFRPLPDWFQRKFNFTWVTNECRTCRYLYAWSNGWEWDKENQRGIPPTTTVTNTS